MVVMVIMIIMAFVSRQVVMMIIMSLLVAGNHGRNCNTMAFMVVMAMRVEGATLAERNLIQPINVHQRHCSGLTGNAFQWFLQERLECITNPEHQIRLLQSAGLRRLQRIGVWRTGSLNDQCRGARCPP